MSSAWLDPNSSFQQSLANAAAILARNPAGSTDDDDADDGGDSQGLGTDSAAGLTGLAPPSQLGAYQSYAAAAPALPDAPAAPQTVPGTSIIMNPIART